MFMYSQVLEIVPSTWLALTRSVDIPSTVRTAAWPPAATLSTLISASCARAVVIRVWSRRGQSSLTGALQG